mgnify:FL=1
MVTQGNIIHFYGKYKENLETEAQILEGILDAGDQEAWMEKLRQKSKVMRRLYIENETLLNLYIRPFLSGEVNLDDALAEELLNQIREANNEGYEDDLALVEVTELLDGYFQKNKNLNAYIWTLNLLGNFYNRPFSVEDGKKGALYFKRLRELSCHYFEIEDFDVRKRILFSYYNYPITLMNFNLVNARELMQLIDEALAFYNDEKVRALDEDKFDFDELIKELNYDLLGNSVLGYSRENIDPQLLERASKVLGEYYSRQLEENPNPYEMPDEIYCNYKRCLFFQGKLDCTSFIEDYIGYCRYCIEHDTLDSQEDVDFSDSRYFQVVVNHLYNIMETLDMYKDEYHGPDDIKDYCVDEYVRMIRSLPRTENDQFINDVVWRSLREFLKYLSRDEVSSMLLMKVMVSRDELTVIHCAMVEQIARRILSSVIRRQPELLVGSCGCANVVEVLENQDKILDFVSQAAQIFDVGKIQLASIINKQTRQLTAREMERIYCHPANGVKLLAEIPALQKYNDIILGHHKSWDGKMGYPKDFDNCASRNRFLIEIFHVSDGIDAATDFIGRSYKSNKKIAQVIEELAYGKGTWYCPELVELIQNDKELQADLAYLVGTGRLRTSCSIYGSAVEDGKAEKIRPAINIEKWEMLEEQEDEDDNILDFLHKSGSENRQLLRALARNSLIILYVDMMSGEYKVSYRGSQRLLDEKIPDGHYVDFLKDYLSPNLDPKDWDRIRLKIKLSELSHTFLEQEGSYECEARVRVRERYRWVRFQFIRLDEGNVMPRMMTLIATDVQESHSRNEQLMASLKSAYQSAEEANKAKSVFLNSMSHDIRTPMNGILGMTQIAMNHVEDPKRVLDCLRKIDDSSRHLLGLINEVLDMSKIESGSTVLRKEPLCLTKTMEIVDGVCRPSSMEKHQSFVMDIDGICDDYVIADPVRLRQILINLISNAVKYTPENGQVLVKVSQESHLVKGEARYTFVVEDNGIGMSEKFLEKLFEPFSREDNSMTDATQGTGLGLSIAKSIISQMGGTIEVTSCQGKGTTFVVQLDLELADKEKCKEEQAAAHKEKRSRAKDKSFLKGHRIMLVEDNELNREIAYELLSEQGLIVDAVENGREALELLKQQPENFYELIFMDIQMPVMNGYEATRSIRAGESPYWKKLPIIAMTANVFQEDERKAAECGMNGYVTKPVDMEVIYSVLEKWLPGIYNS